jgi:hypothetical protein
MLLNLPNDPIENALFESYSEPSYINFIGFVKRYLSPFMEQDFVEEDYYRDWFNLEQDYQYNAIEAPRGHSKSENFTVWFTIYYAVYNIMHEQIVSSVSGDQTNELFDRIKFFFYVSPYLNQYFKPEGADKNVSLSSWNSKKIVLKNESIIHARSIGGKWRGLHVNRIVCDDIITEDSTLSDKQTINKFYSAVFNCSTAKRGRITVIGTPLRFSDILFDLKSNKQFNFRAYPAIVDQERKIVLSPNRKSFDELMKIKLTIGSVRFQCEYMLNPIDDQISIFKREWLQRSRSESFDLIRNRQDLSKYGIDIVFLTCGADFAFSERKGANYSVFLTLAKLTDGRFLLCDFFRGKGFTGQQQVDKLRDLHKVYDYDTMALEENSIMAISKDMRSLGLPFKMLRTGSRDTDNTISKTNAILRMTTWFENNQVIIPYASDEAKEKYDLLEQEFLSFALEDGKIIEIGVHPDIPIALLYAGEASKKVQTTGGFVTSIVR